MQLPISELGLVLPVDINELHMIECSYDSRYCHSYYVLLIKGVVKLYTNLQAVCLRGVSLAPDIIMCKIKNGEDGENWG